MFSWVSLCCAFVMLSAAFFSGSALASEPEVLWKQSIVSEHNCCLWGVCLTDDGGTLACGDAGSLDDELGSLLLVKLSPLGDVQWEKTIGWDLTTSGQEVLQVPGGYLICGSITTADGKDGFFAKFDYFGNYIWHTVVGGMADDELFDMTFSQRNDVIAAGYTESSGAGSKDFWMVCLNDSGKVEWERTFGGAGPQVAYSIASTSDGGFVLAGGGGGNFMLVATDGEGQGTWSKSYDNGGREVARNVIQLKRGGYLLVGSHRPLDEFFNDAWVIMTDAEGNQEWSLLYEKEGNDVSWMAVELDAGGVAVLLNAMSSDSHGYSPVISRIDPWGNIIWNLEIDTGIMSYCYSLIADMNESFFLCGRRVSEGETFDAWLVKTGPENLLEWP